MLVHHRNVGGQGGEGAFEQPLAPLEVTPEPHPIHGSACGAQDCTSVFAFAEAVLGTVAHRLERNRIGVPCHQHDDGAERAQIAHRRHEREIPRADELQIDQDRVEGDGGNRSGQFRERGDHPPAAVARTRQEFLDQSDVGRKQEHRTARHRWAGVYARSA